MGFAAANLFEMWGKKTAKEAHDVLAQPDIVVTNASDKEEQLPKLLRLDELVSATVMRHSVTRFAC